MPDAPRREHTSGLTPAGLANLTGALTTDQRKRLPKSDFVFPEKAPGPGSYPIQSRKQGGVALSLSAGKPEAATVKRVVCRRYPDLPACKED